MESQRLTNMKLSDITINDPFWNHYIDLVETVILPFQWKLINDQVEGAEKSYCMQNFRVACGDEKGGHSGTVFQDTDVAKWLEAVAYTIAKKPNSQLEKLADSAVDLISRAQCPDGYLDTYYIITKKKRWSDLYEGHELYTAGHMIEAAVAYYEATGKRKLLDTVCRLADCICRTFGTEKGRLHGYPGHPEIELALVRLYRVTQEKRYLDLANYFIHERGRKPCWFLGEDCRKSGDYIFREFADFGLDYMMAQKPLQEQTTAEGHAVRAVYLMSGMADVAYETRDSELLKQCETLWDNITQKRMYITGSIGSAAYGERFTCDYDLPNNTNYSESCATIGLAQFSNRMFQITHSGKYMDTVEQAFYNTLLAGIALDGKHFFYVNPLEVTPEVAEHNPTMRHIKTVRQQWFGVACCPPNIARTLASLSNYIYAYNEDTLYVNLFIQSEVKAAGRRFRLSADYPASGKIEITAEDAGSGPFCLAVRKPGYVQKYQVLLNGRECTCQERDGCIYTVHSWQKGDVLSVDFDVPFRFVYCNPQCGDNIGKTALMKGPVAYCLEEADNGRHLAGVYADTQKPVKKTVVPGIPKEAEGAIFSGKRAAVSEAENQPLYGSEKPAYQDCTLTAVPYALWNNRGKGEMRVWLNDLHPNR
ncbi:MAG: glycoside hydrolase family 127 protein [Oscillospiraceae bacterium]|nr:glycoside hydrolase family 127 protein [Oscillospiraceae bacterium]